MYFSQYLAAAILAAGPSIAVGLPPAPFNNIIAPSTTQTVTAYTTYIPTPTQFKRGNTTYTVTQKSWVTVTDCPENCYVPGHQQTVAPVSSGTASEPEATSSTGSSSSTGSTGSSNTGADYSSKSSSSNSTGSGAVSSGNSSSTGSSSGFNGTGSTGTGSNSTGSTSSGSGSNGYGSTGNQNNTPAQTISSGGRLSISLSGLSMAAICFIAL